MQTQDTTPRDLVEGSLLNWAPDAPRGGRAVMNRFLTEKATVPLFFAQTLIQSLRDVGYNHTTSALCEHVDNAIQAKATEVRVFFRETGKKGKKGKVDDYRIDAAVYDNGVGMAPTILKIAMSFGGSLNFDNRQEIGRFGMGMKTAALSMCPAFDLYSWQEPGGIYSMTLDVEAVGKERANLVELPEPTLTDLPDEVSELFKKPMAYPDRSDQKLLLSADEDLTACLSRTGTMVYMPQCDHLTYVRSRTLVDHAIKEMARVYRRAIANGLKLYVNNRLVEASDPTYSMATARHTRLVDLTVKHSRLIVSKPVHLKVHENGDETAPITIKLFRLPIEEWSLLPRKTLRNDLHVFDGQTISVLRNDRELFSGTIARILPRHSITNWYRLQIDFPGVLDEAFGVAANKQGIRLKDYVEKAIKEAIGDEISTITDELKRFQAQQASTRKAALPSASESRASEADPFQQNSLPATSSPAEEAQLMENLKGLAATLKRAGESDDEAFDRVKRSTYIITFRHDEYWPFYDVKHRFGRVILTINTAHPFFTELYDPVSKMAAPPVGADDEDAMTPAPPENAGGAILALDLLLLSLARTQSRLSGTGEEERKLLDLLRREWSETYRIQMTT